MNPFLRRGSRGEGWCPIGGRRHYMGHRLAQWQRSVRPSQTPQKNGGPEGEFMWRSEIGTAAKQTSADDRLSKTPAAPTGHDRIVHHRGSAGVAFHFVVLAPAPWTFFFSFFFFGDRGTKRSLRRFSPNQNVPQVRSNRSNTVSTTCLGSQPLGALSRGGGPGEHRPPNIGLPLLRFGQLVRRLPRPNWRL